MLPRPALSDKPNSAVFDAKHGADLSERVCASIIHSANLHDLRFRQDRGGDALASGSSELRRDRVLRTTRSAPTKRAITRIHFGVSQAQMRRVAARRIVAGMKDEQARGKRPVREQERNAMSSGVLPDMVSFPIPEPVLGTSPRPAGIRTTTLINLRPKHLSAMRFISESRHKRKTARNGRGSRAALQDHSQISKSQRFSSNRSAATVASKPTDTTSKL